MDNDRRTSAARRLMILLNTAGLLVWLVWLLMAGGEPLFQTPEGVLYWLPAIPFFAVYLLLIPTGKR